MSKTTLTALALLALSACGGLRSGFDTQDPGTVIDDGTDPTTDPGTTTDPATDPATDPGTDTATDPGTDTATEPGTDTATDPGTDTGTATDPGTDTATTPGPVDADADGFSPPDDCDDTNPNVYPGAPEGRDATCADGIDENCDGVDNCWEVMVYKGSAAVNTAAQTYNGTTTLVDFDLNAPTHTFCEYVWPATSAAATVPCAGCAFAFTLQHSTASSKTGAMCDTWYTPSSWASGPQIGMPLIVGYHPSYDLRWDSGIPAAPALMLQLPDTGAGATWYGMSDVTSFDGSQFTWSWVFGVYYAY